MDSGHISEYFSLGVCMEGLNTLYQNLFNVYLELETPAAGEIWHSDVYKLGVRDCDSQGSISRNSISAETLTGKFMYSFNYGYRPQTANRPLFI
jgi:hypothetical protein